MARKLSPKDAEKLRRRLEAERKRSGIPEKILDIDVEMEDDD